MRSGRSSGDVFGFDCARADYDRRLAALQSHGVALWDVLRSCRRVGSADSAIDPKSLVVNDFAALFAEHPNITRVYFNGAKAAELLPQAARRRRERIQLPAAAVDQPGPRRSRAPAKAGGLGASIRETPAVMTPAVAGGPTVWPLRSARTATAASPRRTAGRPAGPTSAGRRRRSPTAPPRPVGRSDSRSAGTGTRCATSSSVDTPPRRW